MPENFQIALLLIIGTSVFIFLVSFVIYSVFRYQKARTIHDFEMAELEIQFQKEILNAELEVKEDTLNLVSEEIHDNIGQILSLARLDLHQLKTEPSPERTDNVINLVGQSIEGLRQISHMLSKNELENRDLIDLFTKEIDQINKIGAFEGRLVLKNDESKLTSDKSLIVYRIVQESINNAIKHAKPKVLTIEFSEDANSTEILLKDDGKGFDVEDKMKTGNGLQNLKRRAELINAELSIESSLNLGTEIKINIPHGAE